MTSLIQPSLSFDFVAETLDPRITFTRAFATATRTNSSGFIESVSADTPRFDFNPLTLVCRGLLVEETRTNLILNSNGFSEASWVKFKTNTGVVPVVTPNSGTSPDGTNNAFKVTFNSPASTDISRISTVFTAPGVTATASIYIKAFDTADVGKVVLFRGTASGAYLAVTLTANFQRITRTEAGTFGGCELGLRPVSGSSSGVVNVLVFGAQCEAGAFATSYIPTTTTALTRNADVATITGTSFSDFWQASKGGTQVQAIPSTVSGIRPLVQYDDGTANEIIALRGNTTNPELYIVDGGTPQAQIDAGTIAANTEYNLTGWWATNDCKARLDSGAVVTDTSATIPTVTQARLGSDGTNYLNGHLASISYYDTFSGQIYTRRKNKAVFSLL